MPFLPLPPCRLLRWVLSLALVFLLAMTLLRVGTFLAFGVGHGARESVWPAFRLGLRFDLRVVAAVLLPVVALGRLRFLDPFRDGFGRRFWLTVLGAVAAGLIVLYVADFLHYRYVNQRLNASVLTFLGDAEISASMVWESYPVVWIGLGITGGVAAAVGLIGALHGWAAGPGSSLPPAGRKVWYGAVFLAGVVGIYGRVGQYPLRWSDAFNLRSEASANLALNPVESFTSSLSFRTAGFEIEKVRRHYARLSTYLGVEAPDAGRLNFERRVAGRDPAGGGRRPNVVLVLCESFSGYKSSMWGNPLDPTPFFQGLVRQGVFFDNCFTPHFGTARGVWALLTGTPDVSRVETASRNPAMVDQHTIIDDFAGYEKLYFLGGSSSWANIRGLLTNNIRGLQLYEENSYDSPRIDVWGISDKNLFLEADKVLRTRTQPFFAIIQTADNHRPYTIPKEDLAEFQPVDLPAETVRRHGFESLAELNAFRYTDYSYRKFFEAARRSPYFDDTIFIFIGDHGIGGDAGALFPRAWTENFLTRYHVPLLFYAPKFLPPQRIHAVASMVDVLPTVAGLVGLPCRNATLGRDLLRQQQIDGGAGNVAFIIDHNDRTIGVLRGSFYGVRQTGGDRHGVVWADFAAPPGPAPGAADQADYRELADAFYETSRYLLLNNKKVSTVKPAVLAASPRR